MEAKHNQIKSSLPHFGLGRYIGQVSSLNLESQFQIERWFGRANIFEYLKRRSEAFRYSESLKTALRTLEEDCKIVLPSLNDQMIFFLESRAVEKAKSYFDRYNRRQSNGSAFQKTKQERWMITHLQKLLEAVS